MSKVAVVGDKHSVNLFKLVGCETFTIEKLDEASKLVDRLINGKFALVFMTNSVANQIINHIEKHNLEFTPIIGRIPD